MAGYRGRARIAGHESVFVAARITGQALLRRAERAAVLRGLVIVVASATAASCATAGGLASNGATLAGSGVHRAVGRADAVGSPQPTGPRSRAARLGAGTGPGAYPAAFVAAASQPARHGLAAFSSADGRLLRWLVRSKLSPLPVAVSPGGRWVYFYYQAAALSGRCPNTGFTEPVLWRVPVRGARPLRAGLNTTSIAFSPDGRMVAHTSSRSCGRTVWVVLRDRHTGATRRIVLAHNAILTSNNPIFSAQLSWAPDDRHLAVAVAPAVAINALYVVSAWRATNISVTPSIRPCAGGYVGCLDPAFDVRGRLTFLKWKEAITRNGFAEWVIRWHHGSAIRLLRLGRDQSAEGTASIAVDRTGNAVLLEGGLRRPGIWRWSGGHLHFLLRPTRQMVVASLLWLRRR